MVIWKKVECCRCGSIPGLPPQIANSQAVFRDRAARNVKNENQALSVRVFPKRTWYLLLIPVFLHSSSIFRRMFSVTTLWLSITFLQPYLDVQSRAPYN